MCNWGPVGRYGCDQSHPPMADRGMMAVRQSGYGGREQLSVCEVARPIPKAGHVLVRVKAVSVNAGDHHVLTGVRPLRFNPPASDAFGSHTPRAFDSRRMRSGRTWSGSPSASMA